MIDDLLRKRIHRPIVAAIRYTIARYDLARRTELDPELAQEAAAILIGMSPEEIDVLRALLRQVEG